MTISTSTPTRVVVLLTSIALALVLLLAGAVSASATDDPATPVVTAEVRHTVVVGDTLWGIAESYTDPGDDVRETIYDIRQLNGLADSVIQTGQTLIVPVEF